MGDIVAFYCILVKTYSFRNHRNMDATIEKQKQFIPWPKGIWQERRRYFYADHRF